MPAPAASCMVHASCVALASRAYLALVHIATSQSVEQAAAWANPINGSGAAQPAALSAVREAQTPPPSRSATHPPLLLHPAAPLPAPIRPCCTHPAHQTACCQNRALWIHPSGAQQPTILEAGEASPGRWAHQVVPLLFARVVWCGVCSWGWVSRSWLLSEGPRQRAAGERFHMDGEHQ